jgi:arylformamidase
MLLNEHSGLSEKRWIDVSVPLATGMVHWPGDPVPAFERISEIALGGEADVTFCHMSAHTGTHMDAPRHFLPGGSGIDQFPLEVGIGRARVIAVPPHARAVGRAELEGIQLDKGDRILLKTRNSSSRWDNQQFQPDFAALDVSGARVLAEAGVALVGVDYLSVGRYQADGAETHRLLLGARIWIVEGLNLTGIEEGEYDMVCLPLRIEGSDGSPARVALRPV